MSLRILIRTFRPMRRAAALPSLLLVLGSIWIAPRAEAQSARTFRVSVSSTGAQSNNTSFFPRISDDGRYVVFSSYGSTLVGGDTNVKSDIFVHDCRIGTTTRVSVDSSGVQSNADSYLPGISSDGRYVVFQSFASNLVPGDTNGVTDVFVHDTSTASTVRVSVDSSGVQANADCLVSSISGDGRFVAFESAANNLVAGDTNGVLDVFVHDLVTGITTRASVDSSGNEANGTSQNPSLSADGRYVVFDSNASNLVPGDTNGAADVFVHDNVTGETTRVSVDSSGAQGDGESVYPWISAGGRLVSFTSAATNLAPNDTNGAYDIFLHDLQSGATTIVSLDSSGTQGNQDSYHSAISTDERWVAFDSLSSNLVPGDGNGFQDAFLRDLTAGQTTRVSLTSTGIQGNQLSANPVVSGDGRFVAFYSGASNLVAGDTNGGTDAFVRDLEATSFTSLCDPGADGVTACPCSNAPSGPGQGCDNSAATGGAVLSASGVSYLSADTLVFTTSGEKPTSTSVLLQGTTLVSNGSVYGQGIRCVGGTLKRLYTKTASGGSITVPNLGLGDPTVSARSAAKGNPISAGQSRWYLVFYRDPIVLGGCPSGSTFNATQTGRIDWSL
jgi:Tol biopolymer transport system component